MIGSKNMPIQPIILLAVDGKLISIISFIFDNVGVISFLVNLKFLGKKKNNIKMPGSDFPGLFMAEII